MTGNDRYSDEEIKQLCINESGFNNSVIFYLFNRHIEITDVPLLDYVDTVYIDRNTIQLPMAQMAGNSRHSTLMPRMVPLLWTEIAAS